MKKNKAFAILSLIALSMFAILFFASNLTSTPSVVYAACRPPVIPCTPTRPRITQTKAQPTDTLSPTPTETLTPLPTFTPSNTSTITPSPTVTFTPTFTPTPTATAFPSSVRLNEILSNAKSKDWNKDGTENAGDQWIEIFNLGDHPTDVSNWRIDTGDKTPFFIIPHGATIPAGGFLIFFRKETEIDLGGYEHLRLLFPDGSISDEVLYPVLKEDRVYARAQDGVGLWRTGCVPTPLSPNCQAVETITSQFDMPYFERNIASPTKKLDMQVLITNLLLALILALAIGFFSNLLNDAIETHEQDFAELFGPITKTIDKVRAAIGSFNKIITRSNVALLGFAVKFLVILVVYGIIQAYLDPNFQFINQDGFMLVVALGLSTGFIALVDDLATYIYLRMRGVNSAIRFHSSNFLVVVASTFFSRLTGLVPGLFLGSPAGIEDVPDEHSGAHLDVLAILSTALFGFLAWALTPTFHYDPWLETILLLMFAAGIQTMFFEMLPISYLHGKGIFKFSRILWLFLFILATTTFLQTMLNPNGVFLGAFESANMVLLSLFVIAYCVFCTLVWLALTRLARKRELEKQAPDLE